ncbi:MAG: nuclear transport factor 2 family protein [Lacunisphaera sp.]|nr:nuclear transport factor 2 family protein [Lacunisphaera sp.]
MKTPTLVILSMTLALLPPVFAQAGAAPVEMTVSPATAAIEAKIAANEKDTWEALKRHDASAYAKLSLPGSWGIFEIGSLQITQKVTAQGPGTEILEYKMDDVRVLVLNEQTAIIHYKISTRISSHGKESPAQWMLASAVWVKMGKVWKAAMYQETPLLKQP